MPFFARLIIRTSLIYLGLAFLGWILLTPIALDQFPELASIRLSLTHVFVVGWLTQLIFGVAYWMFPRYSKEQPYGNRRHAWGAFGAINAGLIARVIFEPAFYLGSPESWGLVLAAGLQWIGVCLMVTYLWKRTRQK